jgi:hypothetical protein
MSSDISRPEEIIQEKTILSFNFQNVKLPYESYKGDYATVKYYVKIIIISTYKNAEYEKEFAVVNPYDSSILQKNDEPIHMQVGMKQKLSLSIFFQHKNYNCRGTLKGFIFFNYLNINLKFMEVQIVRREVIFGDKKCEPAYVARYELIDGVPTKNERIPIRFFLKSYNLTPTYQNVDNVFCVRYFLNLVIADEEDNRYFKQKEICLFRLYKERKKYYNNNNYNYNDDEYYNNNDEIFITEPIYEEDYSLDYQPAFGRPNNNQQRHNYNYKFKDFDGINPILPDESYDFGYNNINNYIDNDNRNRNNYNKNDRFNNNYNRNNTLDNNNYRNNNNNRNNINNDNDNDYNRNNNNYNRNNTYNNRNNNNNKIFNNDNNIINFNDDDNYINNNYINNNNIINNDDDNDNDNYNNYQNNKNRQNNYNKNRNNNKNDYKHNNSIRKNEIINNNPSNYYSIKTNNSSNSYNESNMYDDDDYQNNIINTNSNNNSDNYNNIINNNDIPPLDRKSMNPHRNNLMQTRISSEDDFKNIFNSLDKNANKEELKKNIFG